MTRRRRSEARAMRRAWRYLAALVLVIVLSAVVMPLGASAHAQLVRSSPSVGAIVPNRPDFIQLWFSEPVEARFSDVQILDGRRQRVDGGSEVAPGDPSSMIARLGPVGPGVYTVVWKTLSAIDGHIANGSFTFAFGPPDQLGAVGTLGVSVERSGIDARSVVDRWLSYVGIALALGAAAFALLVWKPALSAAGGAPEVSAALDMAMASRVRRLVWVGVGIAILGQLALLLVQASNVGGGGGDLASSALQALAGTRFGLFLFARVGTLLLVGLAVSLGWPLLVLALGGVVLLTLPLAGHSAATSYLPGLAILMDWLHLVATAVWAGGLPVLALAIVRLRRESAPNLRNRLVGGVTIRFSQIGLLSLPVLIFTGFWAAWTHVGALEAVPQNPYGQALAFKVALVVVVLALGAINLLVFKPRLAAIGAEASRGVARPTKSGARSVVLEAIGAGSSDYPPTGAGAFRDPPLQPSEVGRNGANGERLGASQGVVQQDAGTLSAGSGHATTGRTREAMAHDWFVRTLIAEGLVAASILVLAGALTQGLPPVRDPSVVFGEPTRLVSQAEDLDLELSVRPNRATENELSLDVRDLRRRPVSNLARVKLDLIMLDHDMGATEVALTPAGDGKYVVRTAALAMFGRWRVDAVLERSDGSEVRTSFRLFVPEGPAPQVVRPVFAFPGLTTGVVVALESFVGALILLAVSRTLRARRRVRFLFLPAALLFVFGLVMFARESFGVSTAAAAAANPFPGDVASIARGKQTYEQNCAVCHGVGGRGDGPLAPSLRPKPADLSQHVAAHSEAQLYEFIGKGVRGTAMPAWETQLSDDERWDVLNYIRSAFGEVTARIFPRNP